MKKSIIQTIAALCIACVSLSSCSSEISANTYSDMHVGETSTTYMGVILSAREVTVAGNDKLDHNGAGQSAGMVAGGLAGSGMGSGNGNGAAIIGGALLGTIAGAYAEKHLKKQKGIEYVIKLDSGELKTIVQGAGEMIAVGQKVLLMVSEKGRSRVISYNGAE
ncbi:MAG: hypothetical protein L7U87_08080 [Chlamydiales bacterium]|nr:hypothetical protein [Chlamydiales bacterium]